MWIADWFVRKMDVAIYVYIKFTNKNIVLYIIVKAMLCSPCFIDA